MDTFNFFFSNTRYFENQKKKKKIYDELLYLSSVVFECRSLKMVYGQRCAQYMNNGSASQ